MINIENVYPALPLNAKQRAAESLSQLWNRQELGFLQLGNRDHLWRQAEERASQIKKGGIETLVVLGMGGSSLGPRAFWDAFGRWNGSLKEMIFLDNLDSSVFFRTLEKITHPQKTHFLVISKSGRTLETLAMADFVEFFLQNRGGNLGHQCTVVAEVRANPLSDWARELQIHLLEIPEDVGGRFSVFSPVGLLPAALMGCSLKDLHEGWEWAKNARDLAQDLAAGAIESLKREDQTLYFWPYCQGLEVFGSWFQQLWAESLGKALRRDGEPADNVAVPLASLGPRDQHSILQQVMEDVRPHWVWILKNNRPDHEGPALKKSLFKESGLRLGKTMNDLVLAQSEATQSALIQNEIPTLTLSLDGISPKTMSALLFLMEIVVGAIGESMAIDAFNQPGVELGKKLAYSLLELKR